MLIAQGGHALGRESSRPLPVAWALLPPRPRPRYDSPLSHQRERNADEPCLATQQHPPPPVAAPLCLAHSIAREPIASRRRSRPTRSNPSPCSPLGASAPRARSSKLPVLRRHSSSLRLILSATGEVLIANVVTGYDIVALAYVLEPSYSGPCCLLSGDILNRRASPTFTHRSRNVPANTVDEKVDTAEQGAERPK